VHVFLSRPLKLLTDWESTSSWDRLFHLLTTRWEKCKRVSQPLCFFTNFQVCPLIEVSSAFLKKCDYGVDENPFVILNNSVKSALFLLSSRNHRPSWRNLFSYDNNLRWGNICVKRCCILSSKTLSLLQCGFHVVEQYSRCGLTMDLYGVVSTAWFLYFTVLLSRPNIRLAFEYASLQCTVD